MESRLLRAAIDAFREATAPAAQILDVTCPGERRYELLLERKGSRARLAIDLDPATSTFHLTGPRHGAGVPKAETLSSVLTGMGITGAEVPPDTTIARLALTPPGASSPTAALVIEWLGGNPALLVVDAATGEVLASTQRALGPQAERRARGARYASPEPPRRPHYRQATAETVAGDLGVPRPPTPRELARRFVDLPAYLAREAIATGAGDPGKIADALRSLAAAEALPSLYILRSPVDDIPRAFVSPVPLPSLAEHLREEEAGIFRLLERAHETLLRGAGSDVVRASFLQFVDGEQRRLRRLRDRIAAERSEAATGALHRRKAETLIARLAEVPRGASSVRLAAVDAADETLEIELDPAKSPAQNADEHFRRARKFQRSEPLRARRLAAVEKAIAELSMVRERAQGDVSLATKGGVWVRAALGSFARKDAIARWEDEARAAQAFSTPREAGARGDGGSRAAPSGSTRGGGGGGSAGAETRRTRREREERERFRPRSYTTRDGWTVLVGRSNEENDYLTHVIAHPEDLWFHVHGCPGSHVVLRREGRKDNPSAKTIEEAAGIAAYYSKARTSRKAPVIYTLKKYVRKPRGGPAGLASVTRERSIMVEPRVPEGDGEPSEWGA